ncbi:amino acid ABC transporter permease [Azospirillum sp. sgz301742]|jgi:polar amino acid transport system permease protein
MIHQFSTNDVVFLLMAARWTVLLTLIAFLGGGVVGLAVALGRTAARRPIRWFFTGYIQLFQGTPLLMQLFLVFFGVNIIGLSVDPWSAAALGLTLNASAFLGNTWAGAIRAIPLGQWEAARAMGLRYRHVMLDIVLPQAVKVALPPTVGFMVQLLKGTSLAAIIGFTELTRAGQIINTATFQPFLVFGIVAAIYFAMCWPLSLLSQRLERRFGTVAR